MGKQNGISLKIKIVLGYLILLVIISSMVAILFYECKRMDSIYAETMKIRSVCRDINTIHRHITRLAIQEGIVITWEEEGYKECCVNCLCTDSLLQMLKTYFQEYIHLDQIDTPHYLLAEKKIASVPNHAEYQMSKRKEGRADEPVARSSRKENKSPYP